VEGGEGIWNSSDLVGRSCDGAGSEEVCSVFPSSTVVVYVSYGYVMDSVIASSCLLCNIFLGIPAGFELFVLVIPF
jgi:hypothetical protein